MTIIQIADWWNHTMDGFDRKGVPFASLWPDTLGRDAQDDPCQEVAFGPFSRSDGENDIANLAVNHPVLNKGRWEAIQAARLRSK